VGILTVNVFVAPGLVLAAWLLWFWRDRSAVPRWRRHILILGLAGATSNVLIFVAELAYLNVRGDALPGVNATIRHFSKVSEVAVVLLAAALVGAICGKGSARALLVLAAFSGFLLWVVPAIL
jgi:hypothetical protein